ncbi:MAG: flagellar biosynthesis anti-sigma factor FlgM [Desulfovibrio sp.]|jgi:negative regulator of flagellin synthesis FlgM|nr:flagellar biosynthesis anti-sigma factor FlgM [Desulfovibrio sp.]
MEIQNARNLLAAPYAAGLEKNAETLARAAAGRADNGASQAQGGDRVSVSRDALLMTEARRSAQNAPDVRADKVEELRARIASGDYKPDSRLVAENLIREEPGLFRF